MSAPQLTKEKVKEIVEKHYDVGELVQCETNDKGYVNQACEIIVNKKHPTKMFIRQYKLGIDLDEILFEHSLISHLADPSQKTSKLVAKVHQTRHGHTFVEENHSKDKIYFALFDFLAGVDKYTWIDPHCIESEIESSAEMLAMFHNATFSFHPSKGSRVELPILSFLPKIQQHLKDALEVSKQRSNSFEELLMNESEMLSSHLNKIISHLTNPSISSNLPETIIHSDFHPGNLKFENGKAIHVFDFDWSKKDKRIFDIGLALFYFFTHWSKSHLAPNHKIDNNNNNNNNNEHGMKLENLKTFVSAYQHSLNHQNGIGAMNKNELELLPEFVACGNLYVLNWALVEYVKKRPDPTVYTPFLRHSTDFVHWFVNEGQSTLSQLFHHSNK